MDELIYKLWFLNLHIKRIHKLHILNKVKYFKDLWNFKAKDFMAIGIDIITSEAITKEKDIDYYIKLSEYLIKEKIKLILIDDKCYPETLKKIYCPPLGFFVRGDIPNTDNSIAIVGARKATDYGKTVAYKFAKDLAARGVVVVSGMARGIDSCAHRGTLDAKGATIAVLGSGFKNIYPKENTRMMYEIIEDGCVLTEYFPDIQPFPSNFPERNRIISGIAKYILVVEAGERSGSLITVDFALEEGKDVFAVPGNIFSDVSKGTNNLIKEGAKPVTSIDDILEEFNMPSIAKQEYNGNFDDNERILIELLKSGGMSIENILMRSNIKSEKALISLSKLECLGVVKKTYGNYYIIC